MRKALHYVAVLGIICVIVGFGIGFSYQQMAPRIKQRELDVTLSALDEVLPGNTVRPWRTVGGAPADSPDAVFAAIDDKGETIGYAAAAEQQGYSSKVRVMVGVRPTLEPLDDVAVTAVRVISQQETPGLGTRVEEQRSSKSLWDVLTFSKKPATYSRPFLDQFEGKTYNKLEVIRTEDGSGKVVAVTAATISSTAVTKAAQKAIETIRRAVLRTGPALPPSEPAE